MGNLRPAMEKAEMAGKYQGVSQLDSAYYAKLIRPMRAEIGYASFAEAERMIIQYIVGYYSQFRPHQQRWVATE